MNLGRLASGRDNNLNLLRFLAALCVLVSHSFTLATGQPELEPFRSTIGMSLGTLAVDVFFVISGFLVSASAARRSVVQYIKARALRIYPALAVMLVVTVFGIGGPLSSLPFAEFALHPLTSQYLLRNATLLFGEAHFLPGVFEQNPYPMAFNGPLWTLVVEVRIYLVLVMVYAIAAYASSGTERVLKLVTALSALASGTFLLFVYIYVGKNTDWLRLYFMFAAGAAMYCWREQISLSSRAMLVLAATAVATYFLASRMFLVIWVMALPLLVMWAAYVPAGWMRAYNRFGDYSYGVYIYAFPVQQAIVCLWPTVGPIKMIALAGGVTILMAVASWHLIEERVLAYKAN